MNAVCARMLSMWTIMSVENTSVKQLSAILAKHLPDKTIILLVGAVTNLVALREVTLFSNFSQEYLATACLRLAGDS